jgi:5-methylcytosine-specific restriction endonuclease McrA
MLSESEKSMNAEEYAGELILREPCTRCRGSRGRYRVSGHQRPVFCACCNVYQNYNARRAETGEEVTSVRSHPDIPSSQRSRILERDGYRCVMCGRTPEQQVTLHIDHAVTVADWRAYGLPDEEQLVNSDPNLFTVCDECNLGHGSKSIAPVALLHLSLRIAAKRRKGAA